MEEIIKNYLKRSFLSLIPRGHRRERATRSHSTSSPGMSITRLRSGVPQSKTEPHVRAKSHTRIQIQPSARIPAAGASLPSSGTPAGSRPQSRPATTQSTGIRRSRAHAGYARPGYLAPSFQGAGISPPMFRIG